jgi:integrase
MAIFRTTFTKPMPPDAELFIREGQRFARWTDHRGHKRTAKVTTREDGTQRIVLTCSTHTAKYRDGSGVIRKVSTGCRTKDAAQNVLADLRSRAELVKANVMTASQDAAADHANVPIVAHFNAYRDHLTAKGCAPRRVAMVRARLQRLADECPLGRLPDLNAAALERWLVLMASKGVSASTRNGYREAAVGFGNWCRRTHRLIANPFGDVPLANVNADRRHLRRALTEDELRRLLTVARLRPLAEFGRDKVKTAPDAEQPKRANWTFAPLTFDTLTEAAARGRVVLDERPDFIAELDNVGRERALIYKVLLLTGLRKGELASLTVGQLDLDAPQPYAVLNAADEKNRRGSDIPLRADLAADLRAFLADRLTALQDAAGLRFGASVPLRLPPTMPLFTVPAGLVRILDRDLHAAGIAKRDERGRVVDVHAMRVSFGTHLSKGGVTLRTAQAAMRHSKPDLTANVYTDPKLLDVAGALDALPSLSLNTEPHADRQRATGTAGASLNHAANHTRSLVPTLVPTAGNWSKSGSIAGMTGDDQGASMRAGEMVVTPESVNKKTPVTSCVIGVHRKRAKGLEPSTFTLAT